MKPLLLSTALALAVLGAYANHFENGFHFDDSHTVTSNIFIRDLRNVPRFFESAQYSSTLPDHYSYRPVLTTSLAFDYWLGHGLKPFWFQFSTFLWYVLQLVLMFFLFRIIMDRALPQPSNLWTAFFATLCYGLHPANAETVNYVIQRGDLFCTLGIVAGLLWFAARPAQRKYGWYLIPVILAYLAKPPALIFPVILVLYVCLFEQDGQKGKWMRSLRAALPALLATAVFALVQSAKTPATFNAGAQSAWLYRVTQPYVAVYYFKSFFLPTELSADTDWGYVDGPFSTNAVVGFVFVGALLGAAVWAWRRRDARPIAFGLLWFMAALLPTSLMPLAEVTNDHRMFFPFVGLALAVFWALRLAIAARPAWARAALAGLAVVLVAEAYGTHQRNNVWRTDESLWRDVTEKSPRNGRGLMNYGLILMARGDYPGALSYFERALQYTPNYSSLEINLGIANGGLQRNGEAERHFQRAIELAPQTAEPYFFYARWLWQVGQAPRAADLLKTALLRNRLYFDARDLLMRIYAQQNDAAAAQSLARETLQLAPNDEVALGYASGRVPIQASSVTPPPPPPAVGNSPTTPEQFLNLSHTLYQSKQYVQSILAAKAALKLRPDYPEAYNNIAAASNALGRWDEGVDAANRALSLNPNYALARNNLLWALQQKQNAAAPKRP